MAESAVEYRAALAAGTGADVDLLRHYAVASAAGGQVPGGSIMSR